MEITVKSGSHKTLRQISIAGVLTALSFATSSIVVLPNMAPFQHFFNVITAVLLGPWYAIGVAFLTGGLRIVLEGRPILAITGAVFGAALAGLLYRLTDNYLAAVLGEIVGTGIISAIVSAPIMTWLYHVKVPHFYFYIPFFLPASVFGAILAYLFLKAVAGTKILSQLIGELKI